MNIEDIIYCIKSKYVKDVGRSLCYECKFREECFNLNCQIDYAETAIKEAIDALKKQLAQNPVYSTDGNENEYYYCPTCGTFLKVYDGYYGDKYCRKCGQHIQWNMDDARCVYHNDFYCENCGSCED